MITEKDLLQEIELCQQQPITDKKFERLASCFIVYDHLFGEPYGAAYSGSVQTETVIQTNGGSDFLRCVDGKNADKVWDVIDELMDATKMLHPRMYDGVLRKIEDI